MANKADLSFYAELELTQDASEEEVKKRYRELAKKYHPDNLTTGNAEKFKQITQAYNAILNPPKAPQSPPFGSVPFSGAYPFGFDFDREFDTSPIQLYTSISFAESVLGVKKEFIFDRKTKCGTCNGEGVRLIDNGCVHCDGKGKFIRRQGNAIFMSPCPKCNGRSETKNCDACSSSGCLSSQVTVHVAIPPGVRNGNVLRLNNMGNFIGKFGPIAQHTDALVNISVSPDPNFTLVENDVVSKLQISLEEAVKGCKKTVKTVVGNYEVEILPMSRNKDEVIIPNMGVNKKGAQRVILDVQYPDNIIRLVNSFLSTDN